MKRVIVFASLVLLSCKNEENKTTVKEETNAVFLKDSEVDVKYSQIDTTLLNGIWAESDDENALFEIDTDTTLC